MWDNRFSVAYIKAIVCWWLGSSTRATSCLKSDVIKDFVFNAKDLGPRPRP